MVPIHHTVGVIPYGTEIPFKKKNSLDSDKTKELCLLHIFYIIFA
jgi:hypothetical protein